MIFGIFGSRIGTTVDSLTDAARGYDDEVIVNLLPTPSEEPVIQRETPMAHKEDQAL